MFGYVLLIFLLKTLIQRFAIQRNVLESAVFIYLRSDTTEVRLG